MLVNDVDKIREKHLYPRDWIAQSRVPLELPENVVDLGTKVRAGRWFRGSKTLPLRG